LNFIHFSEYKCKIRLVLILRKREDQALISISTILKFSAQINLLFSYLCVKPKQEKLQGHKVVAVILHKFYLLPIFVYVYQIICCTCIPPPWPRPFRVTVNRRTLAGSSVTVLQLPASEIQSRNTSGHSTLSVRYIDR